MAALTAILALCTVLAGAGAAFLSPPYWVRALYLALILAPLTALAGLGWILARTGRARGWPPWAWALLAGLGAAAVTGASFLLGLGPARVPEGGPVSIDLGAWTLAGAGLAGAIAAVGYGTAAAASARRLIAFSGVLLAAAALLSVQPALRSLGLPSVGPLGLAVAAAAVLALRLFSPSRDEAAR